MGACLSSSSNNGRNTVLCSNHIDGNQKDFYERYLEDEILGEGEFGQVKMVHDVLAAAANAAPSSSSGTTDGSNKVNIPLACKILRKGMQFKDNVLYTAIKPEVLQAEVGILRTLQGQQYCLKLIGVYESPRLIYVVTEFCGGGEMMEYVSNRQSDLRTEDVSRIAYQLLSAVDHCAKHGIMHRDVKPENVMFVDSASTSPLRLIDFGSGRFDSPTTNTDPTKDTTRTVDSVTSTTTTSGSGNDDLHYHTTFAGTAFYISPEMFQRNYTLKTDVWSVGVALYVLVAGFPADNLQTTFNTLQMSKNRNLKKLQNVSDMPDSYFELLESLLTYRQKKRPMAGDMLTQEFVQFHKHLQEEQDEVGLSIADIANAAAASPSTKDNNSLSGRGNNLSRTISKRLEGSVGRHGAVLDFKKFERGLTTILATMLSQEDLDTFLKIVDERIETLKLTEAPSAASLDDDNIDNTLIDSDAALPVSHQNGKHAPDRQESIDSTAQKQQKPQKLQIIRVSELKAILKDEMKENNNNKEVLDAIENLSNERLYGPYAYNLVILKEVCRDTAIDIGKRERAAARSRSRSIIGGGARFGNDSNNANNSARSAGSFRFNRHIDSPNNSLNGGGGRNKISSSVHGSNVYSTIGRMASVTARGRRPTSGGNNKRTTQSVIVK